MKRIILRVVVLVLSTVGIAIHCTAEETLSGEQTRQRPGSIEKQLFFPPYTYESIEPIDNSSADYKSVPDRWRQFYAGKWYDPYNQNILKGDVPIFGSPGHEWFFETSLILDTVVERAKIIVPVGGPSTATAGRLDTPGNGNLLVSQTNLITSFSLIRGNTTFKPPEFEFRATPVFNFNYVEANETGVLNINPAEGTTRSDEHIGFLELFADFHLADISNRYDFISSRVGIQSFQSDFRGFIYADEQPGIRLFGNADNNRWQGNLAWFYRVDKDINSRLNTFDARHENVFIANVYRQDAPVLGHQLSFSVTHRDDRAGDHGAQYDDNGFLRRPAAFGDEREKNLHSTYLGFAADGHIGRFNTTTAAYYVFGQEDHNQIAGQGTDISAGMFAQEISYDFDWVRLRGSFFWASGDDDPFDDNATGFDAIFDNPNFAGGPLSFWQRQQLPLIAGGEVFLVNTQSFLPNFRPSKELGQSNFVNPGILLYNLGVDVELTPKAKLITNVSLLQFDQTEPLQAVRQDGTFGKTIGYDFSAGLLYRPFLNNNVQIIAGIAGLKPGSGIRTLYGDNTLYHYFANIILEY